MSTNVVQKATGASPTGLTDSLIFDNGTNVGVATTSPGFVLDVAGSGSGRLDLVRLQNTVAAANNSGSELLFASNRTTGGLTNVAGIAGLITDITNGAYKGALVLSTASNAAPAERARIDNSGNVGIGTTTPAFDANTSRFLAISAEGIGANNIAEIGVGGNITSSASTVGSIAFYNSSLGASEKRVAAISAYTDGATNSGSLNLFTWNAGNVVQCMAIDRTGKVLLNAGQLQFPETQNPSSNVNTLDDYEEGTWIPTLGGSGGETGQSYLYRTAKYTKIGRLITASCYLQFDQFAGGKGTITGNLILKGLPFATGGGSSFHAASVGYITNMGPNNYRDIVAYTAGAATHILLLGTPNYTTANPQLLVEADVNNATQLILSVTYSES